MGGAHHCSGPPRLRNDLYCVELDLNSYYTIPYRNRMASWRKCRVGSRTDGVAGSTQRSGRVGRAMTLDMLSTVHTRMPPSTSTVICYRPKGERAMMLGCGGKYPFSLTGQMSLLALLTECARRRIFMGNTHASHLYSGGSRRGPIIFFSDRQISKKK